jgi:hypothetical protein
VVSGCAGSALHVPPPQPPGTVAAACARLSRVITPRTPLTHAWGSPPIVLRCGVRRPPGYNPQSTQVATVDGVAWFQDVGTDTVRWTAVRHTANIELTVPKRYEAQGGFLVDLAGPIKAAIR